MIHYIMLAYNVIMEREGVDHGVRQAMRGLWCVAAPFECWERLLRTPSLPRRFCITKIIITNTTNYFYYYYYYYYYSYSYYYY